MAKSAPTQKWIKEDVDLLESLLWVTDFDVDTKPNEIRLDNIDEFGKYGTKQFSNKFHSILNKVREQREKESKYFICVSR